MNKTKTGLYWTRTQKEEIHLPPLLHLHPSAPCIDWPPELCSSKNLLTAAAKICTHLMAISESFIQHSG